LEAGAGAVAFFFSLLRGLRQRHQLALAVLTQFRNAIVECLTDRTIRPITIPLIDHLKNCDCPIGLSLDLYCDLVAWFPEVFFGRDPDLVLHSREWIARQLRSTDGGVVVAAARLVYILSLHERFGPDVDEVITALRNSPPRAVSFLVGALARSVGIPNPLGILTITNCERELRKLNEIVPIVIGFLKPGVSTATVYFASSLAFQWSVSEPGLRLLQASVVADSFQTLILSFLQGKPRIDRPDLAISILLFGTLLNLWKRFSDDVNYLKSIYLVVPNLVFPICVDGRSPYSDESLLSALESVALDFVQAVSDGHFPEARFEMTFRERHFAALVLQMRAEREAASRQRDAELERLYSAEMRTLEDISEKRGRARRQLERAEQDGAGIARRLGIQRAEQESLAQKLRSDLAEREGRVAELDGVLAEARGRVEELEERLRQQIAVVAGLDQQIQESTEANQPGTDRIAQLEEELRLVEASFRERSLAASTRWIEAADHVLARADEDAELGTLFAV
jgi:hypothetical protein